MVSFGVRVWANDGNPPTLRSQPQAHPSHSAAQPLPLALAVLGSQLPDIDTTTSIIGQFYPISSWIEDRFLHRSVTHSLVATVAIASALTRQFVTYSPLLSC